jgi:hypothetical protein
MSIDHWGVLATPPKDIVALRRHVAIRRFRKHRQRIEEQRLMVFHHRLARAGKGK